MFCTTKSRFFSFILVSLVFFLTGFYECKAKMIPTSPNPDAESYAITLQGNELNNVSGLNITVKLNDNKAKIKPSVTFSAKGATVLLSTVTPLNLDNYVISLVLNGKISDGKATISGKFIAGSIAPGAEMNIIKVERDGGADITSLLITDVTFTSPAPVISPTPTEEPEDTVTTEEENITDDENLADEEPIDEEITVDFEFIDFIVEDLLSLQDDILFESEDTKNKSLRSVANKVGRVVKYIDKAKGNAEDGNASFCSDDLERALTTIEATLDKIDSRICGDKISKRCIPNDLAESFSLDLEDLLDELDDEVLVDENEDDIPDACGS